MITFPRVPIADAKILIAGTARNCAATLDTGVTALEIATAGFGQRQFLIIESDSTDGTINELDRLQQDGRISFQSLGSLSKTLPLRTQRIAHCRNRILEYVRGGAAGQFDYVIIADLDGVNDKVERLAIESGWHTEEPWDALTANQSEAYYDIWALRHPYWSPDDCWEAARQLAPLFGGRKAAEIAVYARQAHLKQSAGLIEVESAFGGLAIYRTEAYLAGNYEGVAANGQEICEHVPFNAAMRAQGFRIFINPMMLNSAPHEHLEKRTRWNLRGLF